MIEANVDYFTAVAKIRKNYMQGFHKCKKITFSTAELLELVMI